jgi:iron complex outermembrane receptor protein
MKNILLKLLISSTLLISYQVDAEDLFDMDLDELMDIEVSSVSKKSSSLMQSAAAIYVVSNDDIIHSGARNIPEALRSVPGLHVAQISQHDWAVSARGFNGRFANKLLVLIDGRSVYSHVFSGTYWDELEVDIQDVERIEVIRGPGAALWGSNAVAGVINIITKKTVDTNGTIATIGTGSEAYATSSVRHGGKISEDTNYRTWANYQKFGDSEQENGSKSFDDYHKVFTGMRVDSKISEKDTTSLQLGFTASESENYFNLPVNQTEPFMQRTQRIKDQSSFYLLNQWRRDLGKNSDLEFQWFYDRVDTDDELAIRDHDRLDFELKHRLPLLEKHEIIWGAGYRFISDHIGQLSDVPVISFLEEDRQLNFWNSFVQTELRLVPETLSLTLGSRFEYNDYTRSEVQPNARLLYTPKDNLSIWSAYSHAVRIPSRSENDVHAIYDSFNTENGRLDAIALGNRNLSAEEVDTYEIGFRYMPESYISFDVTSYYSAYDKLIVAEGAGIDFNTSTTPPTPFIPARFENSSEANTYGTELAMDLIPTNWLTLRTSYAYALYDLLRGDVSSINVVPAPENQVGLRAYIKLPKDINFDAFYRFSDTTPGYPQESYSQLDLRIAYNLTKDLQLSILGRNLLHDSQQEFIDAPYSPIRGYIQREVFAQVTWLLG